MKKQKYYIVEGYDGYFLTDSKLSLSYGEIVVFETNNLFEAEARLCLEIARSQ